MASLPSEGRAGLRGAALGKVPFLLTHKLAQKLPFLPLFGQAKGNKAI